MYVQAIDIPSDIELDSFNVLNIFIDYCFFMINQRDRRQKVAMEVLNGAFYYNINELRCKIAINPNLPHAAFATSAQPGDQLIKCTRTIN
jgi:hypothetical protein